MQSGTQGKASPRQLAETLLLAIESTQQGWATSEGSGGGFLGYVNLMEATPALPAKQEVPQKELFLLNNRLHALKVLFLKNLELPYIAS